MRDVKVKQIIFYKDESGKEPFSEWLENLNDSNTRRRILQRLFRVQSGNFGDYKSLKDGVCELRLKFGPGYRIYFGEDKGTIVIILSGGDKSTQRQDIKKAKVYWKEYLKNV